MNPSFPRRRKLRLAGFDYSSEGLYFVTICTHRKIHLFGEIIDERMVPNAAGKIVDAIWSEMFRWTDEPQTWIVMPNHIHGVIAISEEGHRARRPLGSMIASFKAVSTMRINRMRDTPSGIVWQRDFYEHIIRNDRSLENILTYIQDNPIRWADDPENPRGRIRTKAV